MTFSNNNLSKQNAERYATPEERQEILQAKRVTSLLHRAYQAFSLYPFDHGIVREFYENFYKELQNFFHIKSELELRLERFEVYYKSTLILEDTNLVRNFVFLLYSDGVRRLYFYEGILLEECIDLFQILHRCSRNRSIYEDAVTLLWERQFEHVDYYLVEDLTESLIPGLSSLYDELEELEDLAMNQHGAQIAVQAATSLSRARLELNEEEEAELRKMIEEEESGLMLRFFNVISLILEFAPESKELDSLLRLFSHLQPLLLSLDEIDHLIRFLELSQHLIELFSQRGTEQSKQWKATLQKVMSEALNEQTLKKLLSQLSAQFHDETFKHNVERYIILLDIEDPKPLLEVFRWSNATTTNYFWASLLAKKYKDNPRQLLSGIQHSHPKVVSYTCIALGITRHPDALALLDRATQHREATVRAEALKAVFQLDLSQVSKVRLRNILEACLKDPDKNIRVLALSGLIVVGGHIPLLLKYILSEQLYAHWTEEEYILFFQAVAKWSKNYPELVEQLTSELLSNYKGLRSILGNKKLPKAALEALYNERSSVARRAFDKIMRQGSRQLRRLCEEIIEQSS